MYLWPYSHRPVTGSQRPPIWIAHLDLMFLQPLSANAAVGNATIEKAAIVAAASARLEFMEIGLPRCFPRSEHYLI
jgi:hypothetical protein